jgi:hypothetical protein
MGEGVDPFLPYLVPFPIGRVCIRNFTLRMTQRLLSSRGVGLQPALDDWESYQYGLKFLQIPSEDYFQLRHFPFKNSSEL